MGTVVMYIILSMFEFFHSNLMCMSFFLPVDKKKEISNLWSTLHLISRLQHSSIE